MSVSKDLREQLSNTTEDKKEQVDPKTIKKMLGFMGNVAAEMIVTDIHQMIEKKLRQQLDGYIFALSRIVRHELAWKCITTAFADETEPVPQKYFPYFGKTKADTVVKRRTVE